MEPAHGVSRHAAPELVLGLQYRGGYRPEGPMVAVGDLGVEKPQAPHLSPVVSPDRVSARCHRASSRLRAPRPLRRASVGTVTPMRSLRHVRYALALAPGGRAGRERK